jgi:hypothetical protein
VCSNPVKNVSIDGVLEQAQSTLYRRNAKQ